MTYEEQADHIATLLTERLSIRGKGLEAKLSKSGRLLPPNIRREGMALVEAVKLQGNPKLARRVDEESTLKSYEACETFLLDIDRFDRRKGIILGFLTTNALNLLIITALVVAVMKWRGLV